MSVIKNVWGPNHTIVVILSASKMMTSYSECPKKTGILVDKADAITPLKSIRKEEVGVFFWKIQLHPFKFGGEETNKNQHLSQAFLLLFHGMEDLQYPHCFPIQF